MFQQRLKLLSLTLLLFAGLIVSGCGDDSTSTTEPGETEPGETEPEETEPEEVASVLGVDTYRNAADPVSSTEYGDETTWEFSKEDGPVCLTGNTFRMHTRDTGSDSLLIFLQGGGACWSDFCLAVTGTPDQLPGKGDLLDPFKEANPFKDWNVTYVPYCDGSIFIGDADRPAPEDEDFDTYYYRGLRNLTAALDVAKEQFPSPKRVVLAGASAGAFGTFLAAPLARSYYPNTDLTIMNDAGVGIGKPGDDAWLKGILEEFGATGFLPDECPECVSNGSVMGLFSWYMSIDSNVRVAMISSWYDGIISQVFLKVDAELFQQTLESESAKIEQKFPDRFNRFIYPGKGHTATLGNVSGVIGNDITQVLLPEGLNFGELLDALKIETIDEVESNGVVLADWLDAMLLEEDWSDEVSPVGTPPQ